MFIRKRATPRVAGNVFFRNYTGESFQNSRNGKRKELPIPAEKFPAFSSEYSTTIRKTCPRPINEKGKHIICTSPFQLDYQDSNLDKQNQNLLCCHYTIVQTSVLSVKKRVQS